MIGVSAKITPTRNKLPTTFPVFLFTTSASTTTSSVPSLMVAVEFRSCPDCEYAAPSADSSDRTTAIRAALVVAIRTRLSSGAQLRCNFPGVYGQQWHVLFGLLPAQVTFDKSLQPK
jgi:hypothetical protein